MVVVVDSSHCREVFFHPHVRLHPSCAPINNFSIPRVVICLAGLQRGLWSSSFLLLLMYFIKPKSPPSPYIIVFILFAAGPVAPVERQFTNFVDCYLEREDTEYH